MRFVAISLLLMTAAPALAASQAMPGIAPGDTRMPSISNIRVVNSGATIAPEIREARDRIRDGEASGQLTRREAKALRREARQIASLADRYGRDGLSAAEQGELDMRARALQSYTDGKRFQTSAAGR